MTANVILRCASRPDLVGASSRRSRRRILPAFVLFFTLGGSEASRAQVPGYEPPDQVPCAFPACPDLVVDPASLSENVLTTETFSSSHCAVVEGEVPAGTHRLLRFSFTTPNIGLADLFIGSPASHPEWFHASQCHGHFHFKDYADYRLWTKEGYARWRSIRDALPVLSPAQVFELFPETRAGFISGEKRGFCAIDNAGPYPSRFPALNGGHPRRYVSCAYQGISVGWGDLYRHGLDGQWIVVDDLLPGVYVLEGEVNAERLFRELDYGNNAAAVEVTIP